MAQALAAEGQTNADDTTQHDARNHIHDKGPVRSADFEHPRKGASGWWEWKPHKRHLEGLFTAGKVMVIERRNFQRGTRRISQVYQ